MQCKASLNLPSEKDIEDQLKINKKSEDSVGLLLWVYMGQEKKVDNLPVLLVNAEGCCNGLQLQYFKLTKKLSSQDQKMTIQ